MSETVAVLISRHAYEQWWPVISSRVPCAVALVAEVDGTVSGPLAEEPAGVAREVALITLDAWSQPETRLLAHVRKRACKLAFVQTVAAGSDGEPYETLRRAGVPLYTSHANAAGVADFVLRGVLDALQGVDAWQEARRRRAWEHHRFRELFLTTWLVVGLGAIGRNVATRASAFGATVVGCRPSGGEAPGCARVVRPGELAAELPAADVVVLAAPANPSTDNLVDAGFLAAMADGSLLVNVARGSLVDETALLAALDAGRPSVAILDAVRHEPLAPESPLWDHPRVVLTPHNAGGGLGATGIAIGEFCDRLAGFAAPIGRA